MAKSLPSTLDGLSFIYDEKEKALAKLEEHISTFNIMLEALDGCSSLLTPDVPDLDKIQIGIQLLREEKEKALAKDEKNAEKLRYALESIETSMTIIRDKINSE